MGTLPFPISAEDIDEYRYQVYELIRQIYEEKIGGADLGDVFDIPGDTFVMKLHGAGGLKKVLNHLTIEVPSDGGLTITIDGLKIKFVSTGGIQTAEEGTSVKLDGTSVESSADGLKLGQSAYIEDPIGGATKDIELRTAINSALDLLIERGLMASSPFPPGFPTAGLKGMYYFDEGSGLAVYDHSGHGWDMAWTDIFGDPTLKVWSVPGFGHNEAAAPATAAVANMNPPQINSYTTIAAFIRPLGYGTAMYYIGARLGEGGLNWTEVGWTNEAPLQWAIQGNAGGPFFADGIAFDTWYFVVVRSACNGGRFQLLVRQSGGSLNTLIDQPNDIWSMDVHNLMQCFGGPTVSYIMDGGDFLFYSSANYADGYISDAELNIIYDTFKGRYGMT